MKNDIVNQLRRLAVDVLYDSDSLIQGAAVMQNAARLIKECERVLVYAASAPADPNTAIFEEALREIRKERRA